MTGGTSPPLTLKYRRFSFFTPKSVRSVVSKHTDLLHVLLYVVSIPCTKEMTMHAAPVHTLYSSCSHQVLQSCIFALPHCNGGTPCKLISRKKLSCMPYTDKTFPHGYKWKCCSAYFSQNLINLHICVHRTSLATQLVSHQFKTHAEACNPVQACHKPVSLACKESKLFEEKCFFFFFSPKRDMLLRWKLEVIHTMQQFYCKKVLRWASCGLDVPTKGYFNGKFISNASKIPANKINSQCETLGK